MANQFLLAPDVISGKEGWVTAVVNGNVEICAYIKTLRATMAKTKVEVKTLGSRWTQHKATGVNGTGAVTIYHITSFWSRLMSEYAKTGKDVYFTMTISNDDPGSAATQFGQRPAKTTLGKCNIDAVDIAALDVTTDTLESTFNFTFSEYEINDPFTPVTI